MSRQEEWRSQRWSSPNHTVLTIWVLIYPQVHLLEIREASQSSKLSPSIAGVGGWAGFSRRKWQEYACRCKPRNTESIWITANHSPWEQDDPFSCCVAYQLRKHFFPKFLMAGKIKAAFPDMRLWNGIQGFVLINYTGCTTQPIFCLVVNLLYSCRVTQLPKKFHGSQTEVVRVSW